jgi:hypothetical protein
MYRAALVILTQCVTHEKFHLLVICKYDVQVQTHGSLRVSSMDVLNNATFYSGPRLFPRRDFLLLNKVGLWSASFPIFTTIIGAVCGAVLLKKEMHIV